MHIVKAKPRGLEIAEELRGKLLADARTITIEDFGSRGSRTGVRRRARVGDVAAKAVAPKKFADFYRRIIAKFSHRQIAELGTSLGITTLYLGASNGTEVTTFEGATEIAAIAETTFEFAQASNIRLIHGNIDTTLQSFLGSHRRVDFVLIDANHRYEPTMRYFRSLLAKVHEKAVMVIDDIHASAEMEKAWNEIRANSLVYGSADLYRCGVLFFDPSLNKQHVILQF